jgi:hypothetical protein
VELLAMLMIWQDLAKADGPMTSTIAAHASKNALKYSSITSDQRPQRTPDPHPKADPEGDQRRVPEPPTPAARCRLPRVGAFSTMPRPVCRADTRDAAGHWVSSFGMPASLPYRQQREERPALIVF